MISSIRDALARGVLSCGRSPSLPPRATASTLREAKHHHSDGEQSAVGEIDYREEGTGTGGLLNVHSDGQSDSSTKKSGPGVYGDNTAAMWASMPGSRVVPNMPPGLSVIEIPGQRTTRVTVSTPGAADPEMIAALFTANREKGYDVVLQDCFGQLDFSAYDHVRVLQMPSMVRPAMPLPQVQLPPGGSIERAMSEDTLAEAERTIVDGMPQRSFQPYQRGQMLPPSLVYSPSWRIWLARIDSQPVGRPAPTMMARPSVSTGWRLFLSNGYKALPGVSWARR